MLILAFNFSVFAWFWGKLTIVGDGGRCRLNLAKDLNHDLMPPRMYNNGVEIIEKDLPECFADHFEGKIKNLVSNARIDPNVYNGFRKMEVADENFMTSINILRAVKIHHITIIFQ